MAEEQRAERQSTEEWLAEERKRLEEGFSFEPRPVSESTVPGPADDILTQLGLGAGVLAAVAGGHENPVTFEGCKASTIANALVSELESEDTRATIRDTEQATMVTILHRQERQPGFSPALTVTLIETDDMLTVAMSALSPDVRRGTIGSIGRTALRGGRRLLLRRRGLPGVLDAAGGLVEGIEEVAEGLQDLSLPMQAWLVIDHVGGAAEETYLADQRRRQAVEQKREAAKRAWTHCEWCGRAYGEEEADLSQCPSCGGARGSKPQWMA